MKKIIAMFLAFNIAFLCFGGCVSDKPEKPTENVTEETTEIHTEKETTTEAETTTEEPTTEETTTEKETTTKKATTTRKPTTTKKVTTTRRPTTTVPVTEEHVTIDFSDVDCEGIDPDKPMVALTFDDGPSIHTPRLLNIFKKHGGKGTFFVVGNLLEKNKATAKRIVNEGHEIASHGWSHADLSKLSLEKTQEDLLKTHNKIFEITGAEPRIVRPPYGAYNNTVKYASYVCKESIVTWSVDTLDWKTRNADAVYKSVMNSAYDGAIILCHDLHGTTVDAMERVIPDLIEKGYQLVTVSQMLALRKDEVVAGQVYYRG